MGLVVLILLAAALGGYFVLTRTGPGAAVSVCSAAFAIHAQDSVTDAPIAGAIVRYGGTSATTDSAGNAEFLDNGTQTLTVTAGGYNTDTQSNFVPALGYVYSFALVRVTGVGSVTITTSATSTDTVACTTSTTTSSSLGSSSTSYTSSSIHSTSTSRTTSETTTETNTSVLETFHGHFEWSHTTDSGGLVDTFNASGTFTITIDMVQGGGNGIGQGTIDDTITGTCTGHSSTDYTFDFGGGINALTGNLTLVFTFANPSTGTTSITCPNSGTSESSFGFTPFVPALVTLSATHGASVQGTYDSGAGTYELTLV